MEGRLSTRTTVAPGNVPLISETYTHDARDKVVQVATQPTLNRDTPSTFRQFYSGLGNLVMTDWANANDPQWQRERFTMDALGNMVHKRTVLPGTENQYSDHPDYAYTLDPWKGDVTQVRLVDVSTHPPGSAGEPQDQTRFRYDEAGNQETSWQRVDGPDPSTGAYGLRRVVDGRSYYGHDGKLRAFQQYEDHFSPSKSSGIWEEYRYDPLGRRVMVITKRPPELCNGDAATCISATTQFVWSGDQLLWEIKSAEGLYSQQAGGVVSYTHGGGIDRPLAIWKSGVGSIIPHENWRGQMARGTYGAGTRAGQSSDCTQYPPQNCEPIPWPGWNTSAWHEEATKPELTGVQHYWYGSLSVGMRDASGQMYMRNRYYNPQSGQFTQPDPIGLAGGMNVYGFAAGDPVSYSDPYGLRVEFANAESRRLWNQLVRTTRAAMNSDDADVRANARQLNRVLRNVWDSEMTLQIDVSQRSGIANWYFGGASTHASNRVVGTGSDGQALFGTTTIRMDPTYSGQQFGVPNTLVLAHEIGHAWSYMRRDHEGSNGAAVGTENNAREILGCNVMRRADHVGPPPPCRTGNQ